MKIFAWSVLVMIPITLFGKSQSKGNVICVNETNIVKLLQGRDGRDGRDGSKGDVGLQGPEGKQGQKGENGATGLPGKSCSCQLKKAVEALMKTTADVSNATIAATGQGSVNYRGIADHSNTEAKVDILTVNQDPISSRDELLQIDKEILVHLLNDYYVAENAYYNKLYHVTSRVLTDGRADTGGWGSKASSAGNWLQATFIRPVYVKTVSVAGGFIPSWNHDTRTGYGQFYLQHSNDGLKWVTARTIPKTVGTHIATYPLHKSVVAQYWRLTSVSTWVATTEFALKPLIKK